FSSKGQKNFVSPWGYISVMGNVITPGRIALPQGRKLRLSEAIALAGGLAPSAKDREVRLARRSSSGELVKIKVNLRAIVAGGKIDEDINLKPGDTIFVPETIF
ncbi:MAG: SLBB domain-containing protein, partial [Kiritimatiellae bacterium]|nr:SLBB domain-containing protein [Kiritimatiellia bacterium]